MKPIAYIHTDLPEKFGIPRQSGLVKELKGKIIFEPEYRSMDAVKGLEGFNYIWLLWEFQGVDRSHFNATVRPPRLGGNTRVGVFATRSPFRPNPIGLSSVHLDAVTETVEGPVLEVSGVDLRDQTPIYDIKPYLPYADCHPDALDGFAGEAKDYHVEVVISKEFDVALLGKKGKWYDHKVSVKNPVKSEDADAGSDDKDSKGKSLADLKLEDGDYTMEVTLTGTRKDSMD